MKSSDNIKVWVVALAVACSTVLLILIARAAVNVPFSNEFDFGALYGYIVEGKLPPLSEIAAGLIGHPLILTKLLVMLTLIAGLPWSWMMFAQVPLLVLTFLIASTRVEGRSNAMGILVVAGLAMAIVTPRHWENLYMAMQICTAVWLASSLGAFYFVDKYGREKQLRWLNSAIGLALLATMNTGAGIFTLLLTFLGLMSVRPNRSPFHLVPLVFGTLVGIGIWALSLALAPKGGIGLSPLSLPIAFEHIVRMFAHTVFDFTAAKPLGITRFSADAILLGLGSAMIILVGYCSWYGIKLWPDSAFETLSVGLGVVLILGVTYARVKMNLFQPDAPRYVVLLVPIVIGSTLLLWRLNMHHLLIALTSVIAIGYILSVVSEWRITPHRKILLEKGYTQLCDKGQVAASLYRYPVSVKTVRNIQVLFCR